MRYMQTQGLMSRGQLSYIESDLCRNRGAAVGPSCRTLCHNASQHEGHIIYTPVSVAHSVLTSTNSE